MEIGELYQFILLIVLVSMILGVGLIVLGNFSTASGVTADAATAINGTIDALSPIGTTWSEGSNCLSQGNAPDSHCSSVSNNSNYGNQKFQYETMISLVA